MLFCSLLAVAYFVYDKKLYKVNLANISFTKMGNSLDVAASRFIAEVPAQSPVYDRAARAEIQRNAIKDQIAPRRKPASVERIAPRRR